MSFGIQFVSDSPDAEPGAGPVVAGVLTLGMHREHFVASLEYWSREQYEASWREALSLALRGECAALITSMPDPAVANVVRWWPIYPKDGVSLVVQEHLLFLRELSRAFDPKQPFTFLLPYGSAEEDGEPISEWTVDASDVRDFLLSARSRGSDDK
jgi:hypothetical protein